MLDVNVVDTILKYCYIGFVSWVVCKDIYRFCIPLYKGESIKHKFISITLPFLTVFSYFLLFAACTFGYKYIKELLLNILSNYDVSLNVIDIISIIFSYVILFIISIFIYNDIEKETDKALELMRRKDIENEQE